MFLLALSLQSTSAQEKLLTVFQFNQSTTADGFPVADTTAHLSIASLDSALVAYYPFDGDASDRSGHGNHGIVVGARLTSDRFGHPRSALLFERVSDSVIIPSSSDFDFSDERAATISCWICGASDAGRANIGITCYGGRGGTVCKLFRLGLAVNEKTMTAIVHSSECNVSVQSSYRSAVNKWHHLACTIDNDFLVFYHNGRMIDKRSLYETKWETNTTNGVMVNTNVSPYRGVRTALDDLRIYNRALSAREVEMLFDEKRNAR